MSENIQGKKKKSMWKPFGRKSEVPNQVPFEKLSKFAEGKYFEVHNVFKNPNVVVKEARTRWKDSYDEGMHPLADLEQIQEDLQILNTVFTEFIPKSQLVVGKNARGEKTVYIIQHKISGSDLNSLPFNEGVNEQLKDFLRRALDMYLRNLVYIEGKSKPTSLTIDLKGENFIFGKDKMTSGDERLYCTDTYPVEGGTPSQFFSGFRSMLMRFRGKWVKTILDFQQEAREKIATYVKENDANIPRRNTIDQESKERA